MEDLQHQVKALALPEDNEKKSIWQRLSYWYWDNVWRQLPYSVKDKYYAVRDWFFPRHRWLTKKIPRSWRDKDSIIEICLFESVKHFVDPNGEDACGVLCSDSPENQKRFMEELKAMHRFITVVIPDLEKKLEAAWDKVPHRTLNDINRGMSDAEYEAMYGEVNRLEKEIEDLKDLVCEWVVKNRQDMWT